MSEHPPGDDERRVVPRLRVGYVPGVTLAKWRRIWDERFPRLSLEVVEVAEVDATTAVRQERVDMCFVRSPAVGDAPGAASDLHAIPLYEEVAVVVAPKDHPVSVFDTLTLDDLTEEELLEGFDADVAVDLVAGGAGLLILPQSVARTYSRRDLVHRPVVDAPPTRVSLVWLRENPHEMIEELIGIVRGRTVNSSRSPRPAAEATPRRSEKPGRATGGSRTGQGGRGSQGGRGGRTTKRPGRPHGR